MPLWGYWTIKELIVDLNHVLWGWNDMSQFTNAGADASLDADEGA